MKYDYLNVNIYRGAFHAFRHNLPMVLTSAAVLWMLEFLTPVFNIKASTTIVPEFFLEIAVAFAIHTTILTGIPNNWKEQFGVRGQSYGYKPFMKKSWALIGIFFAVFIVIFLLAVLLASYVEGDKTEVLTGMAVILFIVVGLPLIGVVFSIYGTMLPAAVAEEDSSFPAAFHRAKGLFWFTFGRLVFGPTLFTLGTFVLVYAMITAGIPVDVYAQNGNIDPTGAVVAFIMYLMTMFSISLTATVLCKTFLESQRRAEPLT